MTGCEGKNIHENRGHKKSSVGEIQVFCLKARKFLFRDEVVVPTVKEDGASAPYFHEITGLRTGRTTGKSSASET